MTSFYSKRFHKLIVCIVLLLPQFALAENMKLEVIPLQHRMVDDVVHISFPIVVGDAVCPWVLANMG